jgi:acyl-CoA dehydrogenase
MRRSVNDAMDLHGGRAICDGPSNYVMAGYQTMPVAITVEGANILTRSLITFAQGALRSHPYLYKEIQACQDRDEEQGLEAFEKAFPDHVAFAVSNVFGAFLHNVTFGYFGRVPEKAYGTAQWYRQLWRASRNFAFVADVAVAVLGGGLKTRQKITGRLADALSELYLVACVLKRYEDDGKPAADRQIVALCARNGLFRFQEAMRGTIDNFPSLPVRWLMRAVVFPLGAHYKPAPDWLGHKCVELVLVPGEVRDRLTRFIYVSQDANDPTGLLETTFAKAVAAEVAEKKLDRAVRAGQVRRVHGTDWVGDAAKIGIVSDEEARLLREVEALTARVIAVDHFDPAEVKPHYMTPGDNARAMQSAAAE